MLIRQPTAVNRVLHIVQQQTDMPLYDTYVPPKPPSQVPHLCRRALCYLSLIRLSPLLILFRFLLLSNQSRPPRSKTRGVGRPDSPTERGVPRATRVFCAKPAASRRLRLPVCRYTCVRVLGRAKNRTHGQYLFTYFFRETFNIKERPPTHCGTQGHGGAVGAVRDKSRCSFGSHFECFRG